MEIILDTSFILNCLKFKIDFLDAGEFGELIVPVQVLKELEKLADKKSSREAEKAELALQIIKENKGKLRIIKLENRFADAGIRKYAEKNKNTAIASMDAELKRSVKNKAKIITIRGRKKIILE